MSFFSAHSYCFQRNYVLLFFFGTPLQYSCLENPMDGGAWWAAVRGVVKSQTRLSDFTFTFLHWRRKWQPTPVFSPGESQGRGSLVGCRPWDRRLRHDLKIEQQWLSPTLLSGRRSPRLSGNTARPVFVVSNARGAIFAFSKRRTRSSEPKAGGGWGGRPAKGVGSPPRLHSAPF